MTKQKLPPALRCTSCGKTSAYQGIGQADCIEMYGGVRCKGTMRSRINPNDWEPCPNCSGTGISDDSRCYRCNGDGHLFVHNSR